MTERTLRIDRAVQCEEARYFAGFFAVFLMTFLAGGFAKCGFGGATNMRRNSSSAFGVSASAGGWLPLLIFQV